MTKYSTGGVSSNDEGSCELCGAEGRSLQTERVAGAQLAICSECRTRHAEGGKKHENVTNMGTKRGPVIQTKMTDNSEQFVTPLG